MHLLDCICWWGKLLHCDRWGSFIVARACIVIDGLARAHNSNTDLVQWTDQTDTLHKVCVLGLLVLDLIVLPSVQQLHFLPKMYVCIGASVNCCCAVHIVHEVIAHPLMHASKRITMCAIRTGSSLTSGYGCASIAHLLLQRARCQQYQAS